MSEEKHCPWCGWGGSPGEYHHAQCHYPQHLAALDALRLQLAAESADAVAKEADNG